MAKDRSDEAVFLLAGVAVGLTLGLLFAPHSGAETRRKIKKTAEKGTETLRERGEELMSRGRDLFEKGKSMADEASEIFESGRKMVQG
jgi:gas vesicle protein